MPGHANAATKSMMARYRRYSDTNITAAMEYLLTDINDTSSSISVQNFVNSSINPCIESTYNFAEHVLDQLINMHADIQPLETFHFGGDEVSFVIYCMP